MSDVKKTRCIICGALFPSEMVSLRSQKAVKQFEMYPKEVCDFCTCKGVCTPYPRKAIPRRYPDVSTVGYLKLAGAIERGVLEEYRRLYTDALKASQRMGSICSDEEIKFLRVHDNLEQSVYHSALTFGNISNLLDFARRDVQKNLQNFHGDALTYIKKRYEWYSRMNERCKK